MTPATLTAKLRTISSRRIAYALGIGLALVVVDYFIGNMSYPIFDDSELLAKPAYFISDDDNDTLFFAANMAYDKELVTVTDDFGDSIGVGLVSSRPVLTRFLSIINGADYRYIFLDINFDSRYRSEGDSSLFALMAAMPRLTFATHRPDNDYEANTLAPIHKSAAADYRHDRLASFSRYEFMQSGRESVALRLYRELNHGAVKPHGIFYSDGWRLCTNTQFVEIPRMATTGLRNDGEILYDYLGSHILERYDTAQIRNMVTDKIVIVGDFDADRHDTYIGEVPGPMLNYYAYRTLEKGRHKYNLLAGTLLWIVFSAIAFLMLGANVLNFKRPIVTFILSLLSCTAILYVLKIGIFYIFGLSVSIVIPDLVYSILSLLKTNRFS